MKIFQHKLDGGASVIWAMPMSGYGHIADEQPLPYIHYKGNELTPRFGGEEGQAGCEPHTVGLPWGVLKDEWALKQRIFNIFRKNINIYWRNIFVSRCRADKNFYFLEQLNYKPLSQGFSGECPLIHFERKFFIEDASVQIEDTIIFKKPVSFEVFCPVNIPLFEDENAHLCEATVRLESDIKFTNSALQCSAAGTASLHTVKLENASFIHGDRLSYRYAYHLLVHPR